MKKTVLVCIAAFVCISSTKAQALESFSVSAFTETMSFPFTRYLPMHPGLEVGITFWQKEKKKSIQNLRIYMGGYHHNKVENGFYLRGEYAYTFKIENTIGIELPVGFGYLQAFYPGEMYAQNEKTKTWERARQYGKPHAFISFGFGLTYLKASNVQPFLRHENILDFPLYDGYMNIKTLIKAGVNIKLNQNDTE